MSSFKAQLPHSQTAFCLICPCSPHATGSSTEKTLILPLPSRVNVAWHCGLAQWPTGVFRMTTLPPTLHRRIAECRHGFECHYTSNCLKNRLTRYRFGCDVVQPSRMSVCKPSVAQAARGRHCPNQRSAGASHDYLGPVTA